MVSVYDSQDENNNNNNNNEAVKRSFVRESSFIFKTLGVHPLWMNVTDISEQQQHGIA